MCSVGQLDQPRARETFSHLSRGLGFDHPVPRPDNQGRTLDALPLCPTRSCNGFAQRLRHHLNINRGRQPSSPSSSPLVQASAAARPRTGRRRNDSASEREAQQPRPLPQGSGGGGHRFLDLAAAANGARINEHNSPDKVGPTSPERQRGQAAYRLPTTTTGWSSSRSTTNAVSPTTASRDTSPGNRSLRPWPRASSATTLALGCQPRRRLSPLIGVPCKAVQQEH